MRQSEKPFRWGIWGTGDVARKFALGLHALDGACVGWVLSRTQGRADEFAQRIGAPLGFARFSDAAACGADAVYIATPAQVHADNAVAALQAGIPVLVEKPFASSIDDAQRIVDAAQHSQTFAMEAMWTRFQPNVKAAKDLIARGAIGTPRLLRGEFCTASLAGGSLYDVQGGGAFKQRGIYPLSLASYLLGFPIEATAMPNRAQNGIDQDIAVQLRHPGGAISQIRASLTSSAANGLEILGDQGALSFEGRIWRPSALRVKQYKPRAQNATSGKLADLRETRAGQIAQRILMPLKDRKGWRRHALPSRGNGYGHQAQEVMNRIAAGDLQSPVMPLDESLALVRLMNRLLTAKGMS